MPTTNNLEQAASLASFGLKRPVVQLGGGQVGTVRSIGVGNEHGEWVIPTIVNGVAVPHEQAISMWRAGKNKPIGGPFSTPEEATTYAQAFHQSEDRRLRVAKPLGFGLAGSSMVTQNKPVLNIK